MASLLIKANAFFAHTLKQYVAVSRSTKANTDPCTVEEQERAGRGEGWGGTAIGAKDVVADVQGEEDSHAAHGRNSQSGGLPLERVLTSKLWCTLWALHSV